MHRNPIARATLLSLLASCLFAAHAAAQPPATSFDQLPGRVRVGDTVWVTGPDGRELKGTLWDITSSSVAVRSAGRTTTFGPDSLRSMSAGKRDSLRNGALIGLGIGLGLAALVSTECSNRLACFVVGGAFYAGVGVGAGVGIDALTPAGRVEIYRRPGGQASRLQLAPIVSPRSQGMVVRIGF
jgi:hypothetical protein